MSTKAKNEWLEWIKAILIALVLAFLLRNFFFATSIVEGASMDPTLENGERVVFNKIVYHLDEPDRNDIVIIERPAKNYVKRVIGEPGDQVEVKNHELYINGEKQAQDYLDNQSIQATRDYGPVEVPEDHYFVMGDNRAVSKDSRNGLGLIKESEIVGRTELVIFPFEEMGRTQ
ncbi:signal peptidase I [Salimicrobium halophilum]|uniref:Signal peptidase I n=1 Tax=Salimicrobium halophilum TaxID=86666 RepID=A0A1G8RNV1_9BACI|nr:signal peptidase I [Salimicrobium halophilum]SDJ18573.1 signal peptidase I [Salimicrobium halophilum]